MCPTKKLPGASVLHLDHYIAVAKDFSYTDKYIIIKTYTDIHLGLHDDRRCCFRRRPFRCVFDRCRGMVESQSA